MQQSNLTPQQLQQFIQHYQQQAIANQQQQQVSEHL